MSQGTAAGNLTDFGQLKYPSDLSEEHFFPEAIKFSFIQRTGVDFKEITSKMKTDYRNELDAQLKGTLEHRKIVVALGKEYIPEKALNPADKARLISAENDWKLQNKASDRPPDAWYENLIAKWGAAWATTQSMLGNIQKQNSSIRNVGTVYLNMPNSISLNESAGWGGQELGLIGNITKGVLAGSDTTAMQSMAGAAVGSAGNLLAAAAGGIVGTVLSKIPGVSGMTGGLLGMIGGNVIQSGAEAAFSVKQNPYMEMMFSGIGFRSYKFDFVFRAKNKSEIKTVGEIIKKFRQHSRPTWVEGGLGKSFMNYPQEFQIQFLTELTATNSYEQNLNLPYLKPAVCTSVDTNFTPSNIWAAYDKGAPVAITLGLSFSETELVMADDVARDGLAMNEQEGSNAASITNTGRSGYYNPPMSER
jgi:hypothetical protein